MDDINKLEKAEHLAAEKLKARALEAVEVRKALDAEIEAFAPRTAVGATALAEIRTLLADRPGALARIRARRGETVSA